MRIAKLNFTRFLLFFLLLSLLPSTEAVAADEGVAWHDLGNGIFAKIDEVKRLNEKALLLRFSLENRGSGKVNLNSYLRSYTSHPLSSLELIDFGTMRTWGCLKKERKCIGSTSSDALKPLEYKQSRNFWVYMTPPPAEVSEIGIKIGSGAPLHGISIQN